MAKRRTTRPSPAFRREDITSWNFIIFLTLAFILLVLVLAATQKLTLDLRSKAGLACPEVTLPRAEDCPGGWKYQRDVTNGCPTFVCEAR